jgi:thiol-disulfide isomerase/thioredoxin/precorrin-6B methylase 2
MRNILLILGILLILWPSSGGDFVDKQFDELEAKAISTVFVYTSPTTVGPIPYDTQEQEQEEEEAPPTPMPGELGDEPVFEEVVVEEDLQHESEQAVTLNTLPSDVNVYVWSATWCSACRWYVPQVSSYWNTKDATRVYKVDYDKYKAKAAEYRITALPTVQIVSSAVNDKGQPLKVWATLNNNLLPSKEVIIQLANQARYNADQYLRDKSLTVPRYVYKMEWGGFIDLDSYARNCNCNMCQNIRYLQQRRQNQTAFNRELPDHQQPSTDEVISLSLSLLNLEEEDVLCSLGCGDARELITATLKYGCNGVGVEIDPERAEDARRAVAMAGLSDKIKIFVGDARDFNLQEHGVTAVYAYLYENLLEELADKIASVDRAVTPFHRVRSLKATPVNNVWLYDHKERERIKL